MRHVGSTTAVSPLRHLISPLGLLLLASLLTACPGRQPAGGGAIARHLDDKTISAAALSAPTAAGEKFTQLSPDESGIDFHNSISDTALLKEEANTQSGMASGDYDGDGDLDLYLLGITEKNKLYRNDGGLHFTDVTAEAGAGLDGGEAYGSSACFADLDGDGGLDLYVANRRGANELFRGDGRGRFTKVEGAAGLDRDSATAAAAIFDADRDGDLDVYLANYRQDNNSNPLLAAWQQGKLGDLLPWYGNESRRPDVGKREADPEQIPPELRELIYVDDSGMVRLKPKKDEFFLNDGRGNFSDNTEGAGLSFHGWSYQAQACDFNDDGWIDLYVSSDFETPDRCFINNGDGTFTDRHPEMWRKSPMYGMGVDTGDINGDGRMDLYVADMLSPDYKRAKVQSGDMYQWRWELTNGQPQPQMRNMLYVNRGGGWMSEIAQHAGVAATDWTWAVRIQDLNCDGQPELFVTNGMLRDSMDVDVKTTLAGILSTSSDFKAADQYWLGQPDYFTDDVIFTPKGELAYDKAPDNWGMHDGSMGCGASLADYDGDGDVDIIVNNTNASLGVWRNDFASGQRAVIRLEGAGRNRQAVGARVWAHCGEDLYTQDVILSRGFVTGESGELVFGLGTHESIDKLEIRWPDGGLQIYENLPAGQRYTIRQAGRLPQWEAPPAKALFTQTALPFKQEEQNTNLAEYKAEPLLPLQQSMLGTGAGVADFDGDGKLDLYLGGAAGQNGALLRGDGQGGFTPASEAEGLIPRGAEQMACLWFDANGDARPDLLINCGGMESEPGSNNYGPRLLINREGGFVQAKLPGGGLSLGAAAAADIDADGDLDLVLGGHVMRFMYAATAPSLVLANDGQGNFSEALAALAPGFGQGGQITDLQFGDFNADGRPDLAAAKNWGGVEIWLNAEGKLVRSADAAGKGWWQGLGLGDFDNDGDLDILAGNSGSNTKYHPKPGQPVLLYANDFDNSGSRDLIEVKFRKDGCMLPGRGRSCSGYAVGYIPQRFPTWHSFADATLEDVYGPGLASAEKYEAEILDNLLLLNNGDGSFAPSKLPTEAQLAPVFGIAVADFNADGSLDAFLANNTVAPQCETGRWNQGYGTLLLGDGQGGFALQEPPQSGILIHDCARTALAADFNQDGALDLAVSISDGEPQLALGSPSGGSTLSVSLGGKAPNTAAVGAQLRLSLSDGRSLLREVQAGSGYLGSYSGPQLFAIPAGLSASELTVRWPDGSESKSTELSGGSVMLKQ